MLSINPKRGLGVGVRVECRFDDLVGHTNESLIVLKHRANEQELGTGLEDPDRSSRYGSFVTRGGVPPISAANFRGRPKFEIARVPCIAERRCCPKAGVSPARILACLEMKLGYADIEQQRGRRRIACERASIASSRPREIPSARK